jgi:UDP-N-acetylglucosamine 1-carboxyvinyltransferase
MSKVLIEGKIPLQGEVQVSGSKNSALKLIAAALFSNENIILKNVPKIENVTNDLAIVEALGGEAEWIGANTLRINGAGINTHEIPLDLGSKYRTASLYAAALVFRFGKARVPKSDGGKIGYRPINRWVETWEALGMEVEESEKFYDVKSQDIAPGSVSFKTSTHMGTDNAILFSSFINGETTILNAAEEPEIDDLISLVNLMGGSVERVGAREIVVHGTSQFSGCEFTVQGDRNEVVTFAVAALVTEGNITIKGVDKTCLLAFTNVLTKMEVSFEYTENELRIWKTDASLTSAEVVTSPYPGFMTDWQPLFTLLATQAEGESTIHDTIYWNRYSYTKDLNRMGTKIALCKPSDLGLDPVVSDDSYNWEEQGEPLSVAKIQGPTKLKGIKAIIPDLRAGATLVVAALAAEGRSELLGFENVTRGYESFVDKLNSLGANIEYFPE